MKIINLFPPEVPDSYLVWSFDKHNFLVLLEI